MNPFLKDILAEWFTTDKQLGHFFIKQLRSNWIDCQCLSHEDYYYIVFQVRDDCVAIGHIDQKKDVVLSAADPDFLPKLKSYLIECCYHTNCNHDPFIECPYDVS